MEVYFYCSYEHSQKGFFMTRLAGEELVPVESAPEEVESFFSYDRFQVLWRDKCAQQERKLWKPQTDGAFFGIRNLRGEMADGRGATANLVILADEDDMTGLRRIALTILGDFPAFQRQFTGWLSVGGHSYQLNASAFYAWLANCTQADTLERYADPKSKAADLLLWMQRVEEPRVEPELLRLAVYTSTWKDIAEVMGNGIAWKLKHPCALTPEEFEKIFVYGAPLWELSSES